MDGRLRLGLLEFVDGGVGACVEGGLEPPDGLERFAPVVPLAPVAAVDPVDPVVAVEPTSAEVAGLLEESFPPHAESPNANAASSAAAVPARFPRQPITCL